MTSALELHDVVKCYGSRRALDHLNLSVPQGSIFGLVGSNGAGKTTSMALTVGLLQMDGGQVNLLGEGAFDPRRHAGRVTLLPQDSRLPLHATVEDLLRYYGRLQGLSKGALAESVDEVLEWVHLHDRRSSPVRSLSHGMMRRVTIAQAFLGKPELVLLDEPMSGLDPREAVRIRHILQRRHNRQTVVISSHNLHELETLCDCAAFIEQGRCLRQDSMEKITHRSQRVTYRLEPMPALPIDQLRSALSGAIVEVMNDGAELSVRFEGGSNTTASINKAVLEVLLQYGVGVLEVRRGSNLESEYFAATAPAVVQPVAKS